MNHKALQLCSRFALQPNLLGYCGRDSAPARLYRCIIDGDCSEVTKELEQFIVLNPYLQTIAQITGKNPFSYEVIESYWIGNDLLKQIKPEHYGLLIENLTKQGVPDFLIEEIKLKIPQQFVPIHLFNILHVGVGRASGSVPFNLRSINNCMVRWGEVRESSKEQVVRSKESSKLKAQSSKLVYQNTKYQIPNTKYNSVTIQTVKLVHKNKQYQLVESTENIPYLPELVGDLKVGDTVALHWGWVAMKISQIEKIKMKKWTERLLECIDTSGPGHEIMLNQ